MRRALTIAGISWAVAACDHDAPARRPPSDDDVGVAPIRDVDEPEVTAPDTGPAQADTTVDLGSADAPAPPADVQTPDLPETSPPTAVPLTPGPSEHVPLEPAVPPVEPATRPRRRLDVDQLDAAMRATLGGIAWRAEGAAPDDPGLFQSLAGTLGRPDFIVTTVEDLSSSALFMRFLSEAAETSCHLRYDADLAGLTNPGDGAPPVLLGAVPPGATHTTHRAEIEHQISRLLLRFHGRRLAPGEPGFFEWSWLVESVTQLTGDPGEGWRALCVALFLHPDFHTY